MDENEINNKETMARALNEYLMNISSKIASDLPETNISFETYLTNSHAEMGVSCHFPRDKLSPH